MIDRLSARLRIISLILLSILFVASAYAAYVLQSLPDEETRFVPEFEYEHEAEFSYTVTLWSSTVYENRTTLMPHEIAFIPLVHLVNVSFSYRLSSEPGMPHNITYRVTCYLESPMGWRKTLISTPTRLNSDHSATSLVESFTLNISNVEGLIRAIEKETKTYAPTYCIRIVAQINLTATAGSRQIRDDFNPEMMIKLLYQEGNRLSFEGLKHERRNTIGEYVVVEIAWVEQARYGSYALSVVSLVATAYAARRTWEGRKPTSSLRKAMKKYEDLIVDSTGLEEWRTRARIRVRSMNDLAKISEQTTKPIIHEQKLGKDIFYVVDADVVYQFTS